MALINPSMIADFTACGGIIMLATGFRLCGIRAFPTANMLPSLILVMPFSAAPGSSLSPETLSFFRLCQHRPNISYVGLGLFCIRSSGVMVLRACSQIRSS